MMRGVLIKFPEELIDRMDAFGGERGRSKLARDAIEHWITMRELEAAHYEISERDGDATGGLPDSTPIPTPESRGQVDAVAPAREVTPAPADISFGKTPALVTELAPEDKAQLAHARRRIDPKECTHPKFLVQGGVCGRCGTDVK